MRNITQCFHFYIPHNLYYKHISRKILIYNGANSNSIQEKLLATDRIILETFYLCNSGANPATNGDKILREQIFVIKIYLKLKICLL